MLLVGVDAATQCDIGPDYVHAIDVTRMLGIDGKVGHIGAMRSESHCEIAFDNTVVEVDTSVDELRNLSRKSFDGIFEIDGCGTASVSVGAFEAEHYDMVDHDGD